MDDRRGKRTYVLRTLSIRGPNDLSRGSGSCGDFWGS